MERIEMQRDTAQRRHHVADPRYSAGADRGGQRLCRAIEFEIQRVAEFGIYGRIAEWRKAQRLEKFFQFALGTATPIMQSRVTIDARRSSFQLSVPAGRIGSTR